jgi:hypothetical protein
MVPKNGLVGTTTPGATVAVVAWRRWGSRKPATRRMLRLRRAVTPPEPGR